MLPTLFRRAVASSTAAIRATPAIYGNPFRTKKVWPPDFKRMTPQEHLRFEKKYKRRIKLAHDNKPRFHKKVKLAQLFSVAAFIVFFYCFSDFEFFGYEYKPSKEFRHWVLTFFGYMDPEKRYQLREDAPPQMIEVKKRLAEREAQKLADIEARTGAGTEGDRRK